MKQYIFFSILAMFLLGSCKSAEHEHEHEGHSHEQHEQHHDGDEHEHEGHSDEITLSPEKAKAARVTVETVKAGSFRDVIYAGGKVLPAQGDEAMIVANATGVVHFPTRITEGAAVGKGAALVNISSAKLQDGNSVERARMAYETAKTEYERAERLAESQIVSQKDLKRIKDEYESAKLAYEALTPTTDGKAATATSPLGGFVKAVYVTEGEHVTTGQPLMSVTQNRRLQLKVELSERYYSKIKEISSANFTTPYNEKTYSLDSLGGKLISYGKAAGESSLSLPVVFEFDNRGDIMPGSFVFVYLMASQRDGVISVPKEALTEDQGAYFVYLQVDEDGYKKQEVKTGASDGKRTEIISGLNEGDRLVTHGAIHVKMASASNAIPGHTHHH